MRLPPSEWTSHSVVGLQIRDFHGDHAVSVDDVGLFDKGTLLGTDDGNGRQVDVGVAQGAIERKDDFAVGLQVAAGHPGLVKRGVLDEAEVTDVVRGAVAALDRQGLTGSKLSVRLQERVEGDERAGLAFAEDADAARELLTHGVGSLRIGADGKTDCG